MGSSSERKHKSSHSSSQKDKDWDKDSKRHKSSHRSSSSKKRDDDDGDEWVEKEAYTPAIAPPPPSGTSAPIDSYGTFSVRERRTTDGVGLSATGSSLTDGFGEGEDGSSDIGAFGAIASGDLFSDMGTERKRREIKEKPDPTQTMGQSSRELNKAHWQGIPNDRSSAPAPPTGSPAPGSSGSAWRMKKVQRTFETAEEEGRPVEEVALERYGSIESWRDALEERRVLDDRRGGRRDSSNFPGSRGGGNGSGAPGTPTNESRRFVYTEAAGSASSSRPPSRGSFRRPGEALERTNSASSPVPTSLPSQSRPATPVPNVFTPPISRTPRPASTLSHSVVLDPDPTTTDNGTHTPILTQSELNKLQAKVLKARLMGNDNAAALEADYERERERTLEGGSSAGVVGGVESDSVKVLPTLDGRGRLYDVGTGAVEEEIPAGKRVKKDKAFESHDVKTGERIRHNPDDDTQTLDELVRQERFSAGANEQKDMDYEIASRIAGDTRFQNNLDYADENAEKLARKKMKSDVLKKAFAVQDYARTKKALDSCTTCFGDEGEPPKAAVVALGTRAYLGLLENEELVKGHCRIVPIQHHFSSLDADEETWDEIKNFMKTLMQMFAEEDKGVVFFESCISLKHQKHTCIEAIPVPFDLFDEIPAYFQEAIDNSEQEWSQHKKRIVFTAARPFRRSLVPNLPYFAVQWDYKGEKGFGHIIEGVDDAPDRDADGYEQVGETGDKGGGEFPSMPASAPSMDGLWTAARSGSGRIVPRKPEDRESIEDESAGAVTFESSDSGPPSRSAPSQLLETTSPSPSVKAPSDYPGEPRPPFSGMSPSADHGDGEQGSQNLPRESTAPQAFSSDLASISPFVPKQRPPETSPYATHTKPGMTLVGTTSSKIASAPLSSALVPPFVSDRTASGSSSVWTLSARPPGISNFGQGPVWTPQDGFQQSDFQSQVQYPPGASAKSHNPTVLSGFQPSHAGQIFAPQSFHPSVHSHHAFSSPPSQQSFQAAPLQQHLQAPHSHGPERPAERWTSTPSPGTGHQQGFAANSPSSLEIENYNLRLQVTKFTETVAKLTETVERLRVRANNHDARHRQALEALTRSLEASLENTHQLEEKGVSDARKSQAVILSAERAKLLAEQDAVIKSGHFELTSQISLLNKPVSLAKVVAELVNVEDKLWEEEHRRAKGTLRLKQLKVHAAESQLELAQVLAKLSNGEACLRSSRITLSSEQSDFSRKLSEMESIVFILRSRVSELEKNNLNLKQRADLSDTLLLDLMNSSERLEEERDSLKRTLSDQTKRKISENIEDMDDSNWAFLRAEIESVRSFPVKRPGLDQTGP